MLTMTRRFFFGLLLILVVILLGNTAVPHQLIATAQSDDVIQYREVAWSPDGSEIALAFGGFAESDIGVLNLATQTITNLTATLPGIEKNLLWSPDSQKLIFDSDESPSAYGLWVMNRDGTGGSVIGDTLSLFLTPFSFSADSRHVLAMGTSPVDYAVSLWALDIENLNHQAISVPTTEFPSEFALSPDSRQIAFFATTEDFSVQNLWVGTLADNAVTEARVVFSTDGGLVDLAWSPDGKSLLFWQIGVGIIFVVNVETGEVINFEELLPNVATTPVWSPDGSQIALTMADTPELNRMTIWVMQPDGANLTSLTADIPGQIHSNIAWSPDGTALIFIADSYSDDNVLQSSDIWLTQADGSNPINLTEATD